MINRLLARIESFLATQNSSMFRNYILVYIGTFSVLCGGLIFYYNYRTAAMIKNIRTLNTKRVQVQELLSKELTIREQQNLVDELIQQDKNFLIMHYFETIAEQLNLTNKLQEKPRLTTNEPAMLKSKGYSELILEIKLDDLNMWQVTQLLEELEKNKRVYIKNLELESNPDTPPTVSLLLTIATLKNHTEINQAG